MGAEQREEWESTTPLGQLLLRPKTGNEVYWCWKITVKLNDNFWFQYAECIPHFQKSVALNSLQISVWIRLGFAALEVEDWETAAAAYRRYCTLDPEVIIR